MTTFDYNTKISIKSQQVTIASGETVSDSIELEGHGLVGIEIPSAFTGTSITFQGSLDNSTFVPLYDSDGTQISVTVSTSRMILLCPSDFIAPKWLKVVSGSSEDDDRSVSLVLRGFV